MLSPRENEEQSNWLTHKIFIFYPLIHLGSESNLPLRVLETDTVDLAYLAMVHYAFNGEEKVLPGQQESSWGGSGDEGQLSHLCHYSYSPAEEGPIHPVSMLK